MKQILEMRRQELLGILLALYCFIKEANTIYDYPDNILNPDFNNYHDENYDNRETYENYANDENYANYENWENYLDFENPEHQNGFQKHEFRGLECGFAGKLADAELLLKTLHHQNEVACARACVRCPQCKAFQHRQGSNDCELLGICEITCDRLTPTPHWTVYQMYGLQPQLYPTAPACSAGFIPWTLSQDEAQVFCAACDLSLVTIDTPEKHARMLDVLMGEREVGDYEAMPDVWLALEYRLYGSTSWTWTSTGQGLAPSGSYWAQLEPQIPEFATRLCVVMVADQWSGDFFGRWRVVECSERYTGYCE